MTSESTVAIVTPVKNEWKNLSLLAESISRQGIKPTLWVIIDDGSDEATQAIIKEIAQKNNYVISYRIKESNKYDITRYPILIQTGLNIILSNVRHIEYLCVIDSDVILADNYLEETVKAMMINPNLGITTGIMKDKYYPKKNVWGEISVVGAAMIIRKSCYAQIGGFPLVHAMPDTIFTIKAIKNGWQVNGITTTNFIHLKPHGWKRCFKSGQYNAWVGYHPVNALFTSLYSSLKPPHLSGIAYLVGYLQGFLSTQRIEDTSIFHYFRKEAFSNLLKNIVQ